jgi:hypothetical protein
VQLDGLVAPKEGTWRLTAALASGQLEKAGGVFETLAVQDTSSRTFTFDNAQSFDGVFSLSAISLVDAQSHSTTMLVLAMTPVEVEAEAQVTGREEATSTKRVRSRDGNEEETEKHRILEILGTLFRINADKDTSTSPIVGGMDNVWLCVMELSMMTTSAPIARRWLWPSSPSSRQRVCLTQSSRIFDESLKACESFEEDDLIVPLHIQSQWRSPPKRHYTGAELVGREEMSSSSSSS